LSRQQLFFSTSNSPGHPISRQVWGNSGNSVDDFEKNYFGTMEPLNQLNEVVIRRYNNINAVSLGIIPSNQKSYTAAERKYATASSGRLNPMGLDPVLNFISGRTAMLKKELMVEKKIYLSMLDNMFDENHFVKNKYTLQLTLKDLNITQSKMKSLPKF
jgi:hypothetical protein